MSTLSEIKKALEGNEKAEEILAFIEKRTGRKIETAATEASQKANKEAKNVRERYKKKWAEFDLDPDSDTFEIDLIEFKDKLDTAKKSSDKSGSKSESLEMQKLQKHLELLTNKFNDSEARASKAEEEKEIFKTKTLQKQAENTVLSELSKGNAIKPDFILGALRKNIILDENEEGNAFFKHGDEQLSLNEGVTKWLDENPEFRANSNHPGGGSGGDKGGNGSPGKTDIEARRDSLRQQTKSIL